MTDDPVEIMAAKLGPWIASMLPPSMGFILIVAERRGRDPDDPTQTIVAQGIAASIPAADAKTILLSVAEGIVE